MLQADNKYTQMQKKFYSKTKNPMYENAEKVSKFKGIKHLTKGLKGIALEFGCGLGRNIILYKDQFKRIDGCDLSSKYLAKTRRIAKKQGLSPKLYLSDGISLKGIPSNFYDVVFSITVLQHIPVYDIRFNIMQDIYRVLKKGGVFSAQMGFGDRGSSSEYYENFYDAQGTNSRWDVRVDSPEQIKKDLVKIGFKNFQHWLVDKIHENTGDAHEKWIFFRGKKGGD